MLITATSLSEFNVMGTDGAVGTVEDLYFDDERWVVRYFVVNTREWIAGRKVLISPLGVDRVDAGARMLHLALDRAKVDSSPPIELHQPVSRVMEARLNRYYGYPDYWAYGVASPIWGWSPIPTLLDVMPPESSAPEPTEEDAHLRSFREVRGYHIAARDRTFGHLEDLLVASEDWAVRHLLLDTRNWWPGAPVIVGIDAAGEIDWAARTIFINLDEEQIKRSPRFESGSGLTREHEAAVHAYTERLPR